MKPLALVLAASIAANALLVTVLVLGRDSVKSLPFLSKQTPARSQSATASSATGGSASVEAAPSALANAIASRDPATLRDQLRALGLPEEVVRRMVRTILLEPYYARYRAMLAQHSNEKSDLVGGESYSSRLTKEERAELRTLSREGARQAEALFGSTSAEPDLENLRYNYLPHDKADQLRQINRDYAEMRTDLNEEIGRFRVASDDQKLKLLEQERRKDIESLLSPAELAEYDLRHSNTASTLRNRLANLTVSDSEFRALFDIYKPVYDSSANSAVRNFTPNQPLSQEQIAQLKAQREVRAKSDEQARALLGDERYAEYNRTGDYDYRMLQAAATRFNLPQQTIEQVYGLRNSISAETLNIANNSGLTPEQKKAALSDLANQARTQVRNALGQEIGDAYLKTNMQWINRVASGNTVTFGPTGSSYSSKPVAPRPKPPATATTQP
ncbi:MAG: hypothetical protein QM715_11280 [Nibricoccus sp.]